MMQGAPPDIRSCGDGDRQTAARALAQAFQEDAVMQFIFPDPDVRRTRLPGVFALLLRPAQNTVG